MTLVLMEFLLLKRDCKFMKIKKLKKAAKSYRILVSTRTKPPKKEFIYYFRGNFDKFIERILGLHFTYFLKFSKFS